MHLALLGDSTLDNGAYTTGGPAVIDHLSRLLPEEDRATLLALDGATTHGIENQLDRMPEEATHAVLSIGGNDAVMEISVLEQPVGNVSEALAELSRATDRFEEAYRGCLKEVLQTGLSTTVCTIYNGAFEPSGQQQVIDAALAMWNDAILQAALDHDCQVIDLRRVCASRDDYTQQIEPNEQGGRKIAKALFRAAFEPESSSTRIGPTGRKL
jgi:hypothetical protein